MGGVAPAVVDVYAALPHHVRHLQPIVDELERRNIPTRRRSKWGKPDGWPLLRAIDVLDVELVIVAGWVEAAELFPSARVVYVEHGAGQRYIGVEGHGYAGAAGLEHVELFISPNENTSDRWRSRYPQAAVETVGCAALDSLLRTAHCAAGDRVTISTHWDCFVCPETRSALPYYRETLSELVAALGARGVQIVAHAHPRAHTSTQRLWRDVGLQYVLDPDEVLETSQLLICDNSSLMYEAAALDVPVLALNAPWYRRDVSHGLRFWSFVPGLECDRTDELVDRTLEALDDAPPLRAKRDRAARRAYSLRDGTAAARAADAIERLI